MDEVKWETVKICPRCHERIYGYPALSRRDNKTYICSECGVKEAMEDFLDTPYTGEKYWKDDTDE